MSKKFNEWMSRKNEWFSAIGGETSRTRKWYIHTSD